MTARLADIVSWSRPGGRIAASGLPRAAVRSLISALFEESAARSEALGMTRKGRDGCRVPLPWEKPGSSFGFSYKKKSRRIRTSGPAYRSLKRFSCSSKNSVRLSHFPAKRKRPTLSPFAFISTLPRSPALLSLSTLGQQGLADAETRGVGPARGPTARRQGRPPECEDARKRRRRRCGGRRQRCCCSCSSHSDRGGLDAPRRRRRRLRRGHGQGRCHAASQAR